MERRPATPEEARALSNPLRLRILRHCLDEPVTNEELARRLQRDPGTIRHHVRVLVDAGFLEPVDVRTGRRGALERPYRSTGKSWTLDVGAVDPTGTLPMVDAFRAELLESPAEAIVTGMRLGVRLSTEAQKELSERLAAVVEEFAARDDPEGEPIGIFVVAHRRGSPG